MRSTFTEEDLELPDSGALKGENTAAAEAVPQESLEKAASLIREQIAATKHEEEEVTPAKPMRTHLHPCKLLLMNKCVEKGWQVFIP